MADEIASVFFGSFYEVLTAARDRGRGHPHRASRNPPPLPGFACLGVPATLATASIGCLGWRRGRPQRKPPRPRRRLSPMTCVRSRASITQCARFGLYAIDASAVPPSLNGPDAFSMLQGGAAVHIHGMGSSMLGSFAGMWSSDNLATLPPLAAVCFCLFRPHAVFLSTGACRDRRWKMHWTPARCLRHRTHGAGRSDGGLIGELLCRAAASPISRDGGRRFFGKAPAGLRRRRRLRRGRFRALRWCRARDARAACRNDEQVLAHRRFLCASPARFAVPPIRARAKQVFGGIARLMGTVGSRSPPWASASTRSSTPNASRPAKRWSRPRR